MEGNRERERQRQRDGDIYGRLVVMVISRRERRWMKLSG